MSRIEVMPADAGAPSIGVERAGIEPATSGMQGAAADEAASAVSTHGYAIRGSLRRPERLVEFSRPRPRQGDGRRRRRLTTVRRELWWKSTSYCGIGGTITANGPCGESSTFPGLGRYRCRSSVVRDVLVPGRTHARRLIRCEGESLTPALGLR